MSEQPVPPTDRPGAGKILLTLAMTAFFTVRTVRWWLGVAAGTTNTDSMTTWGWVRLVIAHVGAIGGIIIVAGMLWSRLRAPASPPDAKPDQPASDGA